MVMAWRFLCRGLCRGAAAWVHGSREVHGRVGEGMGWEECCTVRRTLRGRVVSGGGGLRPAAAPFSAAVAAVRAIMRWAPECVQRELPPCRGLRMCGGRGGRRGSLGVVCGTVGGVMEALGVGLRGRGTSPPATPTCGERVGMSCDSSDDTRRVFS